MPTPPISELRQQRYKDTMEAALRDGFNPPRQDLGGRGSSLQEAARRLLERGLEVGDLKKVANRLQVWLRRQERLKARGEPNTCPDWSLYARPGKPASAIPRARVDRYILTAAQDDTDVHGAFWSNLRAYAAYIGAQIMVAPFTYQHALYTDHTTRSQSYRPEVVPYLRFDQVECGGLLFAAEMNTLPTAVDPVSGLDTYGRGRTTVFPHAKQRLKSVPVAITDLPIQVLTTGACTIENYIPKKAGLRAQFHHIIGAVVVEATAEFTWHRHISATADGSFYDLDCRVSGGVVSPSHRADALTCGDVHYPYHDETICGMIWGGNADSIVEALRPRHVILHDLVDMRPISRHEEANRHHGVRMLVAGEHRVEDHIRGAAGLLRSIERDWCHVHVAESNHDQWLTRWTQSADGHRDPANALYWHRLNAAALDAVHRGDEDFHLFRWALADADPRGLDGIDLIPEGSTFRLHEIELGSHGHRGPNGTRASTTGLARTGRRQTRGDAHSPDRFEGLDTVGISCRRNQGYNKGGPNSWAHCHGVLYPNGKRTLIFQHEETGRWRG